MTKMRLLCGCRSGGHAACAPRLLGIGATAPRIRCSAWRPRDRSGVLRNRLRLSPLHRGLPACGGNLAVLRQDDRLEDVESTEPANLRLDHAGLRDGHHEAVGHDVVAEMPRPLPSLDLILITPPSSALPFYCGAANVRGKRCVRKN